MTAEVAILNTHGIALATDSAVTVLVGDEKKVYNTANKLFALSKYHPVGIMIYNKATYMEIDWEIIIKDFRKSLKNPYKTLFEYAENFINYVKEYPYITEEQQEKTLSLICDDIITLVCEKFFIAIKNESKLGKSITLEYASQVMNTLLKGIRDSQEKTPNKVRTELDLNFVNKYKNDIFSMVDDLFEKYKISMEQKETILEIIIADINKANHLNNYSGIVIAGYGENEIFPSLYQCEICGKIGKSLILFDEKKDSISYKDKAMIMPFAQREMVDTFMAGIDPNFRGAIDQQLNKFMISLSGVVGDTYKDKLMKIKDEFIGYLSDIQQNTYINPIMSIVEALQKLDLAEMAETLVNLTAFKRHVSKDAETVGGPTDVAIITKGDGFVWIKRKHYFDIKLNRFFQQNYFLEDGDG